MSQTFLPTAVAWGGKNDLNHVPNGVGNRAFHNNNHGSMLVNISHGG